MYFMLICALLTSAARSAHLPPKNAKYQEFCMCVPFWQCDDDFSNLMSNDINPIKTRDMDDFDFLPDNAVCTKDFDLCCKIQCGRRRKFNTRRDDNNFFTLRILGDDNQAGAGEFPWMLGILYNDVYKCGASLIHPKVALTAAHCVENKGAYVVRAGEWDWNDANESMDHQDRTVVKIITHPLYHGPSLRNDISLLILDQPFHLSDNVGAICLPRQDAVFNVTKCIATGWGKNSFKSGTYESILKMVELPMVPRERCLRILQAVRLGPAFKLHDSFLCAGGEPNKDTCKGDGGSPLVCPTGINSSQYVQVGIVSWGLTCGLQNTPGVYVNVAAFRDWIDKQMTFLLLENYIYTY